MLDVQTATAHPHVTRREDYQPPDWLVPEIHLDFDLGTDTTRVRATLSVERNGTLTGLRILKSAGTPAVGKVQVTCVPPLVQ